MNNVLDTSLGKAFKLILKLKTISVRKDNF